MVHNVGFVPIYRYYATIVDGSRRPSRHFRSVSGYHRELGLTARWQTLAVWVAGPVDDGGKDHDDGGAENVPLGVRFRGALRSRHIGEPTAKATRGREPRRDRQQAIVVEEIGPAF